MARDEDAFMATVARESAGFVRKQRRLFDAMRRVPFTSYELRADWSAWGDIARPGDRARYADAEDVTIPVTDERYRIRGLDKAPAVEDLFYTFVQRDGAWLIASDIDVEDLGFQSARHPWDYGPVRVDDLGAFSLIHHPCKKGRECARLPDGAEALLVAARARARPYWPGKWPARVGVVLPSSRTELRRTLQANFDVSDFVAFAYSTVGEDRYSAPRIVLNWRTLEGRSPDYVERVFAHELVHVATRSAAGPFVPIFVDEGIADYAANGGSAASLAFFDLQRTVGGIDGSLPEDFEFTTGSGSAIFLNYQTAQSAVGFFVQTWGLRAFQRFYRRLGSRWSVPGSTEFHVSDAMRRTIGIGARRFERAWADSLGL